MAESLIDRLRAVEEMAEGSRGLDREAAVAACREAREALEPVVVDMDVAAMLRDARQAARVVCSMAGDRRHIDRCNALMRAIAALDTLCARGLVR